MTNRIGTAATATWLNRLGILLVWFLITAGVAFLVAHNAAGNATTVDVTAPLPPVAIDQRATVGLAEKSIVPIVSANGSVVKSSDGWLLEAAATSDELAYRLLDPPIAVKALINGGPTGFDCAWAGTGRGRRQRRSYWWCLQPRTGQQFHC